MAGTHITLLHNRVPKVRHGVVLGRGCRGFREDLNHRQGTTWIIAGGPGPTTVLATAADVLKKGSILPTADARRDTLLFSTG